MQLGEKMQTIFIRPCKRRTIHIHYPLGLWDEKVHSKPALRKLHTGLFIFNSVEYFVLLVKIKQSIIMIQIFNAFALKNGQSFPLPVNYIFNGIMLI